MDGMLAAGAAEFLHFYLIFLRSAPGKGVIPVLTVCTSENISDAFSHNLLCSCVPVLLCSGCNRSPYAPEHSFHAMTSVITPAPTVWPPSRIANRTPFSIAIGV